MSQIPTNDEPVFSLNSAGIGTCEWAVTERTMQWDSRMHVLFGLEPKLFSGRYDDFLALVDSSDRDRLIREIATGLGQGGDFGSGLQIALPSTRATRSLEMRFKFALRQRTRRGTSWSSAGTSESVIASRRR
jgi:hypothetical protein